MSENDELKRLRLAVQIQQRQIGDLLQQGLATEIDLRLKQAEIDKLKAAAKPAPKAKK